MLFKKEEKHITDSEAIRNLPHNRKEVFFDLLRHRKMYMFSLSCFTFMFFIPLAVDLFLFNYLESISLATEQSIQYLFSLIFYSMVIMIPCMMIGFLGFAGAFYTAKKVVWQEGTSVAVDFFQGIKENWKQALLNGFIFAIFLFGLVVGSCYLIIFMKTQPILLGVGIGALVLLFLMFGMVIALNFSQMVYYENGFFNTMKNSFCLLGLLNWKIFVLYLLTTCGVVALCCFNMITLAIGLLLFAIFNSVVVILYTLISHSGFDKYINKENYPDMVGKGLYKKVEDKEA